MDNEEAEKKARIEEFKALPQTAMADELQKKWLVHMYSMFETGSITSTDMATLARVLLANGWTLDPTKLPSKLRDKLTENLNLNDPDVRDELGIVGHVGVR